ncbi:Protein of unknown function [Pseudarthrobacter equi]|uniref:DUF1648 domain-containing protein n=1 Tax=Pseudarthrobacter equi TaxID=728066 RepID=A0A1H2AUV8_9MICC|nr:DUF5808 domain-containing protein [Pseudarthrobacter equi]SDT49577.1 Protein of unknown function [Pseudarthrobacter equi]
MTVAIILTSALLAMVTVLALALPAINSATVPFGVRVPSRYAADPVIVGQIRTYRKRVLASAVVVAAATAAVSAASGEALLLPLSVLVLVGTWYACFVLANHAIRAVKAAGGWFEGVRQAAAADAGPGAGAPSEDGLEAQPARVPFPWPWLVPALAITAATLLIGVLRYPSMPGLLAVHYGADGVPDRLAAKSVGSAFSLVFVQCGLTALLAVVAAAVHRSRPDIDPAYPVSSVRWHRRYTAQSVKALLGLVAMIDLGMLFSSLLMWTGTVSTWAPLAVVLPVLAGVTVAAIVLARNNRVPDEGEPDTGLTHVDDDRFWRGGLVYVNRDDPALMVPRRFGLGWTLNFGNPGAAMFLVGVLAFVGLVISIVAALRLGG